MVFPSRWRATIRNSASALCSATALAKSATRISRRGESSSSLKTDIWSLPRAKSMLSLEALWRSISTISSEALFSGKNIMSMPMSLNRILFSGERKSSSSILAITRSVPSFLARRALTMLELWDLRGFTAMKRSAVAQPASLRLCIDDVGPRIVLTSAEDARALMREGSSSMTLTSLPSAESIFARWEPTCPAPSITIFIFLSVYHANITFFIGLCTRA